MRRLIIKKLIVISQSEERSLEVSFSDGLNIICGGNKTGKSSIIKSIFTTLGCECKKTEKSWKELISNYILYFEYGNNQFCITREKKKFQIFRVNANDYECLIETEIYHEYSNLLMEQLGVNMPCVSKEGKEFNITPPLLFRFQYIDQDDGWTKLADSFSNVAYIKDWKSNTNKYVCGYLTEDYFMLKAKIARCSLVKDELQKKYKHNKEFVTQIEIMIPDIIDYSSKDNDMIEAELVELIATFDSKKRAKAEVQQIIGKIENKLYTATCKLQMVKSILAETNKDIDFAMHSDDELICPTCGVKISNNLANQMSLIVDIASGENLTDELLTEIETFTRDLEKKTSQYKQISDEIKILSVQIKESQKMLSYANYLKNEGKQELYISCLNQLKILEEEIEGKLLEITQLTKKVDELKSKKRANDIKEDIENYCRKVAEKIDISKTFIKLRDFVQKIERTGSETPRIIYMYQVGLYLYNLDRCDSPFNFLVIDTPNQQGQDIQNLKNIYNSLTDIISKEGQVILGTERETGFEKSANTLYLNEKRRCLQTEKYDIHIELMVKLNRIANKFMKDNFIN